MYPFLISAARSRTLAGFLRGFPGRGFLNAGISLTATARLYVAPTGSRSTCATFPTRHSPSRTSVSRLPAFGRERRCFSKVVRSQCEDRREMQKHESSRLPY
ncbi:hypothetical protein MATL_G00199690 [Megalops atlanticus]|uniref:Uncharacterized protein n=1 Tax=Megalops atlanticus TaxID=7932 RepID=A0A9D3PK56_MEGAT|nr:hypothetical protein MATL_G00199690 [Megalops atlanticus]